MKQVDTSGRTVEEAVDRAAAELGVDREDLDVEILDPGTRGMLGLGAREARVRVTLTGSPGALAHTVMARLLQEMGFPGAVRVHQQEDVISVQVSGEQLGALIGRRDARCPAAAGGTDGGQTGPRQDPRGGRCRGIPGAAAAGSGRAGAENG